MERAPVDGCFGMRQVVLDTETTGMSLQTGNRVVEIGCLELLERRPSGRNYHQYVNPERDSEPGALRVHGLSTDFLSEKPRFDEVIDEFLDFVQGAELVIHNAQFDVAFLDAELERCGPQYGRLADHVAGVVDTIVLAREKYPGQRVSLDALCRRFDIDNAHRTLHGALLDAELLADVYIAMTSGQFNLAFDQPETPTSTAEPGVSAIVPGRIRVVRASAGERLAHEARLAAIEKASGRRLWLEPGDGGG